MNSRVSHGVVHKTPKDFKDIILSRKAVFDSWQAISSLARNEWICWITSAKKLETREKRISRACEDLAKGKKRPCCWAGCPHRKD